MVHKYAMSLSSMNSGGTMPVEQNLNIQNSKYLFWFSAGQDCYTRIWSIKTGQLLTSIPPPHPASRNTIPVSHLYTLPHGNVRQTGLLMASHAELHFYS